MIKIYGGKMSSAGRCYWTAEEAGVPYEGIEMDFAKGDMKTESYLKLNPNGKIPTMEDNGFVLWESMAINRYLASKYKPELLGANEQEHALVDQWSFWAITAPQVHCEVIMGEAWSKRNDAAVIARATESLSRYMKVLDDHLIGRDFVVGSTFTLADINVASVIGYTTHIKFDLSPFVSIHRWMDTMTAREGFKKAMA